MDKILIVDDDQRLLKMLFAHLCMKALTCEQQVMDRRLYTGIQ